MPAFRAAAPAATAASATSRRIVAALVAALTVAAPLAAAPAAVAAAPTAVFTLTVTPTAAAGDTVEATLTATGVSDLYAYDLELTFPDELLAVEAEDITGTPEGGFDSAVTDAGSLILTHTRLGTSPGLSTGPGETLTLGVIPFSTLAAGTATIDLSSVRLVSSTGEVTTLANAATAPVVIAAAPTPDPDPAPEPQPEPEPSTTASPAPTASPSTTAIPAPAANGSSGGDLAVTGSEAAPWLVTGAVGVALIAAGAVFVIRRRRQGVSE
ncbi:cohesin domain-containing protein [Microbacterium sp. LMI1-1-1.1]|uniref:cohesin domain-containing protein n=1 Tax=Microbacterium sp. LMI1-1-1.1 TaxID=3135223 RepID=UPI0034662097